MHIKGGHDIHIPDNKETTPFQLAEILNKTLTTKKGKTVGTAFYLSNQHGKEYMKHKINNMNASISNSHFSFVNIIGGANSPASPDNTPVHLARDNVIIRTKPKH